MKTMSFTKIAFLFLMVLGLLSANAYSQWNTGQSADMVFGSGNYTSSGLGSELNNLNAPTQIIVHPTSNKVFIADQSNNRILRYASYLTYTNGMAAEMELKNIGMGNTSLSKPHGIAIDASNNLWIADTDNHRVLCFADANNLTNHTAPVKVLGQSDFITKTTGSSMSKMNFPAAIFISGSTLWVSDRNNNRVLRFNNVHSKTNGAAADAYLGTGVAGISANEFILPFQIYVDKRGALWVADYSNHRVLRFSNAQALNNSANADLVLGQPTFDDVISGTSNRKFNNPIGVYGDDGDRIYVSDLSNNRIMVFLNSPTLVNNAEATYVIGQPGFSTTSFGISSTKLHFPFFLFVNDHLWVADQVNSRALRFTPLTTLPVTVANFNAAKTSQPGEILLEWETSSESNNSYFEVHVSNDGKNFTQAATIASKATKGNSSEKLSYNFTLVLNQTILAGFGLLSLLLLPAFKNKTRQLLLLVLLISGIAACSEQYTDLKYDTIYVKLVQVDLDGKTTELGIKAVSGLQVK